MIYDDLVAVHDQLNGPLEKMGNLYQQVNDQISAAVAVDAAGAVTVDQAALRAAISRSGASRQRRRVRAVDRRTANGLRGQFGWPADAALACADQPRYRAAS